MAISQQQAAQHAAAMQAARRAQQDAARQGQATGTQAGVGVLGAGATQNPSQTGALSAPAQRRNFKPALIGTAAALALLTVVGVGYKYWPSAAKQTTHHADKNKGPAAKKEAIVTPEAKKEAAIVPQPAAPVFADDDDYAPPLLNFSGAPTVLMTAGVATAYLGQDNRYHHIHHQEPSGRAEGGFAGNRMPPEGRPGGEWNSLNSLRERAHAQGDRENLAEGVEVHRDASGARPEFSRIERPGQRWGGPEFGQREANRQGFATRGEPGVVQRPGMLPHQQFFSPAGRQGFVPGAVRPGLVHGGAGGHTAGAPPVK